MTVTVTVTVTVTMTVTVTVTVTVTMTMTDKPHFSPNLPACSEQNPRILQC